MARLPRCTSLCLALLVLCSAPVAVRAEQPAPEASAAPAGVAAELQLLNSTLARIAALLERQLEGQRLDLRLKRLEVASRLVESLEDELARARSSRTSLADERFGMQSRLEMMATEVEQSDSDSLPMYEAMTRQAERHMKLLDTRLAELDARILELENELTRRRDDLQALQDRLDRELDGLE
jgi:chromosome segregation ATPase